MSASPDSELELDDEDVEPMVECVCVRRRWGTGGDIARDLLEGGRAERLVDAPLLGCLTWSRGERGIGGGLDIGCVAPRFSTLLLNFMFLSLWMFVSICALIIEEGPVKLDVGLFTEE